MLGDIAGRTLAIVHRQLVALGNHVQAIHRIIVRAHVVITFGATAVIIERHARADDVNHRSAGVRDRRFDQRHQLRFIAGETARGETYAKLQRHAN